MAMVFNSVDEMLAYVERACEGSMELVGEVVKEQLKDNLIAAKAVDTGKLIDSIESDVDGGIATIKFANGAGHTSWWGSEKMGIEPGDEVYIAHWIEEGRTGTRDAAHSVETTVRELEAYQEHTLAMKDGLARYGIDATY